MIKFARAHNKMNNIWAKLHKLEEDEREPNLGDYSVVSTNEDVVQALKQGLKDAQRMNTSLNSNTLPYLDHLSILARVTSVTSVYALHCPCKQLAPYTADLLTYRWGTNPPTLAFGTFPLIGNQ